MKTATIITPEIMIALDKFRNSEEYQAKLSALNQEISKHKPNILRLIAEAKAK